MVKQRAQLRLTAEALELSDKLEALLGVSRTAVIEMAIRELARKHQVQAANNQHSERGE